MDCSALAEVIDDSEGYSRETPVGEVIRIRKEVRAGGVKLDEPDSPLSLDRKIESATSLPGADELVARVARKAAERIRRVAIPAHSIEEMAEGSQLAVPERVDLRTKQKCVDARVAI